MPLAIENDWWVAGAAVLAAAGAILWVSRKQRSFRWRTACIALPIFAATMAALALANPTWAWSPRASRVIILLDLSASTRTSPWQNPGWLRRLAQERLGANAKLTIVTFGGGGTPQTLLEDVPVNAPQKWPTAWNMSSAPATNSDIRPALNWRSPAEARNETPLAPRWLITDGYLQAAAINLLHQPFQLGWTAIPPTAPDLAVTDVQVQPQSMGLEVLAQIVSTGAAQGSIEILRDGRPIARQPIAFDHPGERWISVQDNASPATHHYEVIAHRSPADPWPENDHGAADFFPKSTPPRVLIVGHATGTDGLKIFHPGIMSANAFPQSAANLLDQGWQVIVLNDLSAQADETQPPPPAGVLPQNAAPVLDAFVRQTGGGLLILGRKHAFGPGHYAQAGAGPATLEGLSPLSSEQVNRPAATVIFVIDASGSMNDSAGPGAAEQKFRLAARGAEQAVALLLPQDRVAVVTFNDHAQSVISGTQADLLQENAGENAFRTKLDAVAPTGNTVPDTALPEIFHFAGNASTDPKTAAPKMVVLLTDGEIPHLNVARWQAMLASTGCAFTVVAPPPAADSPLAELAKTVKAPWLATDDAGAWASLLKRAVADQITGKAYDTPIHWRTTNSAAAPANLRGISHQWIATWKKPEAREIVAGDNGQTLAALAQRGLGRVAAIAFSDQSESYDTLLQHVITQIAPPPGDRRFTVTAERDGSEDRWRITAEGIENGKFIDHASLRFHALGGPEDRLTDMPQTAAGRYQAIVQNPGTLSGIVVRQNNGETLIAQVRGPQIASAEWPASFGAPPLISPRGADLISPDPNVEGLWRPQIRNVHFSFAECCWIAAACAAIAALWLRRGPGASRST